MRCLRLGGAAIAVTLLAAVPVGAQTGWQHQLILPQGQRLLDVAVLDANTAVAVGFFGTVVRTTDHGSSWAVTPQVNGITERLHTIEVAGSHLFAIGYGGVLLRSIDGGATWTQQFSPVATNVSALAFTDELNGWLASDTQLYRTYNGGATWSPRPPSGSAAGMYISDICAVTPTRIVIVGSDVAITYNDGATWNDIPSVTSGRAVANLGESTIAIADAENVYLSTDYGSTFNPIGVTWPGPPGLINDIGFSALGTLVVAGEYLADLHPCCAGTIEYGRLWMTSDLGANWTSTYIPCSVDGIGIAGTTVATAGVAGQIHWSTNGGANWTLVGGNPNYSRYTNQNFYSLFNGVIIDTYGFTNFEQTTHIWRTTDGGASWLESSTWNNLYGVAYQNTTTLYAAGERDYDWSGSMGIVTRSTDGGATWTEIYSVVIDAVGTEPPTWYRFNGIDMCGSGHGIAVGVANHVSISVDASVLTIDGVSVTEQTLSGVPTLNAVSMWDCDNAVAVGQGGTIVRTTDGGATWMGVTSGTGEALQAVDFADASVVYASGNNGTLLKSSDAGITWSALSVGTVDDVDDVSFADALNGMVVAGSNAYITSNGGASWTADPLPTGGHVGACSFFGAGNMVASTTSMLEVFAQWAPVPVAIQRFDARATGGAVSLAWELAWDETITSVRLLRKDDADYKRVAEFPAQLTGKYVDDSVVPGTRHSYLLEVVLPDGDVIRSSEVTVMLPRAVFSLEQNTPNPFNPVTTIRYSLAEETRATLRVYDSAGRRVVTLVDGELPAGSHVITWDGKGEDGQRVASGVYFYRLATPAQSQSRKFVLLK